MITPFIKNTLENITERALMVNLVCTKTMCEKTKVSFGNALVFNFFDLIVYNLLTSN